MRNTMASQPTARGLQMAVIQDLTDLFKDDRYKSPAFLTDAELEDRKPDSDPETWTDKDKAFWDALQRDHNRHQMAAPMVFAQYLPLREVQSPVPPPEGGDEDYSDLPQPPDTGEPDEPFPYIIVRLDSGGIEAPTASHRISLILLVGIYDDDPNNTGHTAVMEIIERIQQHYRQYPAMGAFSFVEPVSWYLQEEPSYPYYFGAIDLTFDAPAPQIIQGSELA